MSGRNDITLAALIVAFAVLIATGHEGWAGLFGFFALIRALD